MEAAANQQIELARWRNGISVLLLGCIALFLYDVQVTEVTSAVNVNGLVRYKNQLDGMDVELKRAATNAEMDATIHAVGQKQPPRDASAPEMIRSKRDQFFEQLKTDYGEDNFAGMFFQRQQQQDEERTKIGRSLFTSTHGKSWKRLERKFKIKLLEAKLLQGEETSRLVWASGGHSSAAGHGNFLDEAYTAVMERTMKPIFASVGIDFEARPYAMGGTSSGEELALCLDQIFGEDIDMYVKDVAGTSCLQCTHFCFLSYDWHAQTNLGLWDDGNESRVETAPLHISRSPWKESSRCNWARYWEFQETCPNLFRVGGAGNDGVL